VRGINSSRVRWELQEILALRHVRVDREYQHALYEARDQATRFGILDECQGVRPASASRTFAINWLKPCWIQRLQGGLPRMQPNSGAASALRSRQGLLGTRAGALGDSSIREGPGKTIV
jgi:hypothetical protein